MIISEEIIFLTEVIRRTRRRPTPSSFKLKFCWSEYFDSRAHETLSRVKIRFFFRRYIIRSTEKMDVDGREAGDAAAAARCYARPVDEERERARPLFLDFGGMTVPLQCT